ncbi:hypothetical protein K435DRAFT_662752, partial [Dendrothele bispora CBS 962.96]
MELGAPIICVYLLDNPDHYTSHIFKPFHWSSYVTENGHIFGLSRIYDYIYRPLELENMTLYDWIRRCERVKISSSKKSRPKKDSMFLFDTDTEEYNSEDDYSCDSDQEMIEDGEETEPHPYTTNDIFPTPPARKNLSKNVFPFVYGHPLADSHATKLSSEDKKVVPNFIGPGLPRRDKGDREYYCLTMLTFFKPWRSGEDLKHTNKSWDKSFVDYSFSQRYRDIMNNFQLRYECLDSRDDFIAQRNK